ncbi:hypothetical protein C8J24_2568 [Sphingomonas aerolata]|uniref:Transposase n=1 Tax=Sphingomonas aerolata TaxID=185951 RepID=A0A2T4YLT3_9SPHN|nr:hypothetical protein C8J24_2568 [Sphingomonas aerolata]
MTDAEQRRPERPVLKKTMTPAVKRQAVAHLRTVLGMSERRAYAVVEADRTRMRYRSCRGDEGDRRSRPKRALAAATLAHRHPLLAIQPIHLLQVHASPLAPERDRQPPVAEPTTLVRDLAHPDAGSIVLPAKRFIMPCRPIDPDKPAGTPLGETMVSHQLLHCSVALRRPDQFISSRSFSRRFLSSSAHNRAASDTVIPPYFAFQL